MDKYLIVIDTNAFGKKEYYDFKNSLTFNLIKMMSAYSNIQFFMPDIVKKELEAHIIENIQNSYLDLPDGYLKKYCCQNIKDIEKIYLQDLEDFIKNAKLNIIDSSKYINIEDVNNWYFNKEYPFEKRKKDEFPDAMLISAIANYFKDSSEKVVVISNDNGFKKGIEMHTNCMVINDVVSLVKEIFIYDDEKFKKIKCYLANSNLLKNINTYQIINNYCDKYDNIEEISYSYNYINVLENYEQNDEENIYLVEININLELKGNFEFYDYNYDIIKSKDIIKIDNFDLFTEVRFSKSGDIISVEKLESDIIDLNDYVN